MKSHGRKGSTTRMAMAIAQGSGMTMRWSRVLLCAVLLICTSWRCTADADADTHADSDDTKLLRFSVPFEWSGTQGWDLQSVTTTPPDLRVQRVLREDVCMDANQRRADRAPTVHATDRLVAVDGIEISLQTFEEAISMPGGSVAVLPLFSRHASRQDANILSGFARIEILRPQSVEFQPTTIERATQIRTWRAALVRQQQEQQEQQQAALEQAAARRKTEEEEQVQQEHARREKERLEMTPHDRVKTKRNAGIEFRYQVEFTTLGPIGLNWDLHTSDRTIVSHLDAKLPAERLHVIEHGDQLIALNGIDTSAMGPYDVVEVYQRASPPRSLVFRCDARHVASSPTTFAGAANTAIRTENWTATIEHPSILRGWHVPMHLASWSRAPPSNSNESLALSLAMPMTACGAISNPSQVDGLSSAVLAYRGECSFVEKAKLAANAHATALVVVNNVKGAGRFPKDMPAVEQIDIPVAMISKLDGEVLMAVLEHETAVMRSQERDASHAVVPDARALTNAEMTIARNEKKAARALVFWYTFTNTTTSTRQSAALEFKVLPALFGARPIAMPYRIVMAYPQENACHPQGLGVHARRAVILALRGGCSFATKLKAVQEVGGAGLLLVNSDNSLLPLMSDAKEARGLTIWAASIGHANGSMIRAVLELNKNLPSLVRIAPTPIPPP